MLIGGIVLAVVLLIGLIFLLPGFFTVGANEVGIVTKKLGGAELDRFIADDLAEVRYFLITYVTKDGGWGYSRAGFITGLEQAGLPLAVDEALRGNGEEGEDKEGGTS